MQKRTQNFSLVIQKLRKRKGELKDRTHFIGEMVLAISLLNFQTITTCQNVNFENLTISDLLSLQSLPTALDYNGYDGREPE